MGVGGGIVSVDVGEACTFTEVGVREGVEVCVEVSVGSFSVAVGFNVRVSVLVGVASSVEISSVDVAVAVGEEASVVEVTEGVSVGGAVVGGAEVSVG